MVPFVAMVAVTTARVIQVINEAVPIDTMILQYQRQIQQQKFNYEKYLKISTTTSSVFYDAMMTDGKLQFQRTKHQRKKTINCSFEDTQVIGRDRIYILRGSKYDNYTRYHKHE